METDRNYKDISKVAKGAGISFAGMTTGRALSFLGEVIAARLFGPKVFGLYVIGLTSLRMAELLARFGLHAGAMRFVSIYKEKNPPRVKGILLTSFSFSLLFGMVLGCTLYLLAEPISNSIFHNPEAHQLISSFAFGVPIMASMMVIATATQGFHVAQYSVYIKDIIQPSVNILFIVIFISLGSGILGLVYAFILSQLIALIAGIVLLGKLFPGIKDRSLAPEYNFKELFSFSIPLVFMGFLHFLIPWTVIIALGTMKSPQEVGIYRAASELPLLLPMILVATNSIYSPVIASLYHEGQMKRMEQIYIITTRWIYLITIPISLIIIFSARGIMQLFGEGFIEKGVPVLILLTIAQLINCVTGGVGLTLSMTGKQNLELANSISLVILNLILCLMLIPPYGVFGASIATATSIILINLLRLLEVYLLYHMFPYSKSFAKVLIPTGIAILLLIFIQTIKLNILWNAGLNLLIVGSTFLIYVAMVQLDEEDKYILHLAKLKFVSRLRGLNG